MKTDLEEMERGDPKQHAALLKAFKKQRAIAAKTGEKLKFNISQFDAEKAKELSKVENLGKNPSAAALASRVQLLGGDNGMSQRDISEGEKLLEKAASGVAGVSGMDNSSKDSAFAGDGILAPHVQSLMDDIVKKRKRTEPWAPETLHPKL